MSKKDLKLIPIRFLPERNEKRRVRWYFGGLASASAICLTHPLDLLKVQLQTQVGPRKSIGELVKSTYKNKGFLGFYNGISASLFRQLTYTTARFALYEGGKEYVDSSKVRNKLFLAVIAGVFGGIIGVPSDVVNVRMQNDPKLPIEQQRQYKHVFDGFAKVIRSEGVMTLFNGWHVAVARGALLTIGTNATYDQVKMLIARSTGMEDKLPLHFLTSSLASIFATIITQPLDVTKTVLMNSGKGEFRGLFHVLSHIAKGGPLAFFKGILPSLFRVSPNTIITFVMYEQLRLYFGHLPPQLS